MHFSKLFHQSLVTAEGEKSIIYLFMLLSFSEKCVLSAKCVLVCVRPPHGCLVSSQSYVEGTAGKAGATVSRMTPTVAVKKSSQVQLQAPEYSVKVALAASTTAIA